MEFCQPKAGPPAAIAETKMKRCGAVYDQFRVISVLRCIPARSVNVLSLRRP